MTRAIGSHQSARAITTTWLTPPAILSELGGADSFDLDPCAAPAPRPWATARNMISLPTDGLSIEWDGRVWLNPPYSSREIGAGKFVRTYTPAKTQRYEDMIRCEAANAMGDRLPVDEACSMVVTAYVPIPKSMPKKHRQNAVDGILKPCTRPDADNYAKAALDGCNAIIFRDDSCVTDLIVRKRYSDRPRLVITIETERDYA